MKEALRVQVEQWARGAPRGHAVVAEVQRPGLELLETTWHSGDMIEDLGP